MLELPVVSPRHCSCSWHPEGRTVFGRLYYRSRLWYTVLCVCLSVASRSQRVSLIVIPFCLSGCLSVIPRPTAYHDWSITTKFGWQVYSCPRTRVRLFGSPISHTFSARGKNMQIFAYLRLTLCCHGWTVGRASGRCAAAQQPRLQPRLLVGRASGRGCCIAAARSRSRGKVKVALCATGVTVGVSPSITRILATANVTQRAIW